LTFNAYSHEFLPAGPPAFHGGALFFPHPTSPSPKLGVLGFLQRKFSTIIKPVLQVDASYYVVVRVNLHCHHDSI